MNGIHSDACTVDLDILRRNAFFPLEADTVTNSRISPPNEQKGEDVASIVKIQHRMDVNTVEDDQ